MKCGTTALFKALSNHPQVAPSVPKEPNFFSTREKASLGLSYYDGLFPTVNSSTRVKLEASTDYTKYPHSGVSAPAMLKEFNLDYRFVYIVRSPVHRFVSHTLMALSRGWMQTDAIQEPDAFRIDLCRYMMQIERYLNLFDRSSILVIRYEDLSSNFDGTIQQVLEHIQLSHDCDLALRPANTTYGEVLPRLLNVPYFNLTSHDLLNRENRTAALARVRRMVLPDKKVATALLAGLERDLFSLNREFGIDVDPYIASMRNLVELRSRG